MDRIEEIKERLSKASDGPWESNEDDFYITCGRKIIAVAQNVNVPIKQIEANQQLIAHAREDIPFLLSRISALEAEVKEYKEKLSKYERKECLFPSDCPRDIEDRD
jgi:hypothetical protein